MSGFEKQTYTQVPNSLFEVMQDMDECELKVVLYICRHTFGFHRDEMKISTRKLSKAIKMSIASVDKGANAAVVRGLIERITDGQNTTLWRAIVSDSENESPDSENESVVIQKMNQIDSENESQVGVKESNKIKLNKNIKGKRKTTADPRSSSPEIILYRSIRGQYPKKHVYDIVIKAIQKINERLGRDATRDDILPFWEEWASHSAWNPDNLAWLKDWAVTGVIPTYQKQQQSKQPQPPQDNFMAELAAKKQRLQQEANA